MKIAITAVTLLLLLPLAAHADIEGVAKVIDGRTIEIDGQQIRLWGIDAPDIDQVCYTPKKRVPFWCGVVATDKLGKLLSEQPLLCKEKGRDDEGRLIAICYVGRIDINEQAVINGWAVADPGQSDRYKRVQAVAHNMREGLWRSSFVMPWEWRQGKRLPPKSD